MLYYKATAGWVGGGSHGGHDGGYPAPARVLSLCNGGFDVYRGGWWHRPYVPGTHHSGDLRGGRSSAV